MNFKLFWNFFKTTFYSGIIFILPVALFLTVIIKFFQGMKEFSQPYIEKLGIQTVFGEFTASLIVIFIIMFLCFAAGLLLNLKFARIIQEFIDSYAIKIIPGYEQAISETKKTIDAKLGRKTNLYDNWNCVLIKENLNWSPVFITSENDDMLTLFYPSTPNPMSGNSKLISKNDFNTLQKKIINTQDAISFLKKYGDGGIAIFNEKEI